MLTKVISSKTVFGDKATILEAVMNNGKKDKFLYRVFGVIDGYSTGIGRQKRENRETGELENTTWTKFSGDFRAIHGDTSEMFEASTAFLPEYVSGAFITTLNSNDEAEIAFAFDIYAVWDQKNASYQYVAQRVKAAGEDDKVAAMATALPPMPGAKQIAAPAKK